MGRREKRKEKFRLLRTKRSLKHSGTPVSSNQIKKSSFSTIWCVVVLRWLSRDQNTELKATTCNLTVEGYVQTHTRKVRTHNSHKYILTSLRSCKLTKLFFQLPNSLFFFFLLFFPSFFLSPGFPRVRKAEVLPGYRPVWPVTCHLTLLWAHALRSATGWAPAGQLARLLAWSYANEKPQETSIHPNSQMGGQRGGQTNGDMVAEDLDWVVKYYRGVFTEEFGDFCVSWSQNPTMTRRRASFSTWKRELWTAKMSFFTSAHWSEFI